MNLPGRPKGEYRSAQHKGTPVSAIAPLVTVRLDGLAHHVLADTTLAALVLALGHEPLAVATAVNGQFVPRNQRESCLLNSGDTLLLFQPIVGG